MRQRRLNSTNKIQTLLSRTTTYIDYSEEKQILEVGFFGGSVYQYKGVDSSVWDEYKQVIICGGSSGKFVNERIKPTYLSYRQV